VKGDACRRGPDGGRDDRIKKVWRQRGNVKSNRLCGHCNMIEFSEYVKVLARVLEN